MKGNSILAAVLAVCALFPFRSAAAQPTFSEDQSHSVQILSSSANELDVTVFRHSDGDRILLWSRTIPWNQSRPATHLGQVFVSNDGKVVIVRDRHPSAGREIREGKRLHILDQAGRNLFIQRAELESLMLSQENDLSLFTPGYLFDGSFDFLLDEERLYALWSPAADRWLMVSLDDFTYSLPANDAEIEKLNRTARLQALKLVRQHQPGAVREWLGDLKFRLGKLLPVFNSNQSRPPRLPAGAYTFLAARKDPRDKHLLEALLHFPLEPSHFMEAQHDRVGLEMGSSARTLGDLLLSRWENPDREIIFKEFRLLAPKESLSQLACAHVEVALPKTLWRQPGVLWVYLIPAHIPRGEWNTSTAVIPMRVDLNTASTRPFTPSGMPFWNPLDDSVRARFSFLGVHPGTYRAKAIWDANPQAAPATRMLGKALPRRTLQGPGDCESAESVDFTLNPGDTHSFLLQCTNLPPGSPFASESSSPEPGTSEN